MLRSRFLRRLAALPVPLAYQRRPFFSSLRLNLSNSATASAPDVTTVLRNKKTVGLWLLTTAGAVFFMVVLGGVTR
jgi:hypothetical protein